MRLHAGPLASILAGAGLVAPALTFGVWALRDVPEAFDLTGRPGITLTFLLLLTVPIFILAFGLLGRIVLAYLEEDEGRPPELGPERKGQSRDQGSAGRR